MVRSFILRGLYQACVELRIGDGCVDMLVLRCYAVQVDADCVWIYGGRVGHCVEGHD